MFSIVAMNSIGRDKTKSNTPFELNFLWIPCLVSNIKNIYTSTHENGKRFIFIKKGRDSIYK